MTRTGARRIGVAAMALAAVLAGCSGDDSGETSTADDGVEQAADGEAPGTTADAGDEAAGEAEDEDRGAAPQVAVGGDTAGRQVIREASVTLTTDDPEATVDAIGRAAEQAGGFVDGTDLHREGGVLRGTVTVRVPADQLPAALGRIEAAGAEVTARQLSSRDVTTQVADVEARLRNLRALETQLVDLLAEARDDGGTQEVLRVFDRIREVREEIERLDGRRTALADLVELATVTVRVEPTPALLARTSPERDPEPTPFAPAQQLTRAWQATIGGVQTLASVAIWGLVTVLPLLLLWGLPLVLAVVALRRWRRHPGGSPPPPTHATAGSIPSGSDADQD